MGHVSHGEEEKYRLSVGKLEGKRIFIRPRLKWDDDVKMGLKELRWKGTDWINLAEDWNK